MMCNKDYRPFFEDCLIYDVQQGYSLVTPRDAVLYIPDALITLLNVHEQNTINERVEIINKKQLMHNQRMMYD